MTAPQPESWSHPGESAPPMWRPDEFDQFTHHAAKPMPEQVWTDAQQAQMRAEIDRLMERQEAAVAQWQKDRSREGK